MMDCLVEDVFMMHIKTDEIQTNHAKSLIGIHHKKGL